MADHAPVPSPVQDQTKSMSSILGSAKIFTPLLSPTSTLDSRPFFPSSLCGFDLNMSSKLSPKTPSATKYSWGKLESSPIGLALISSEDDLKPVGSSSEPRNKMVVFGTQLKVKIPTSPPSATSPIPPIQLPKSPSDFGIKTRNNNLHFGSPNSSAQTQNSPQVFPGCRLSVTEMELSEEYTRVISHGPNPKTTHIFDDCVLESCYGDDGTAAMSREEPFFPSVDQHSGTAPESFLSFCYTCKKRIGPGNDVFIYRGERAFCSGECRSQEMVLDGF